MSVLAYLFFTCMQSIDVSDCLCCQMLQHLSGFFPGVACTRSVNQEAWFRIVEKKKLLSAALALGQLETPSINIQGQTFTPASGQLFFFYYMAGCCLALYTKAANV